jgi:hypothetical protein
MRFRYRGGTRKETAQNEKSRRGPLDVRNAFNSTAWYGRWSAGNWYCFCLPRCPSSRAYSSSPIFVSSANLLKFLTFSSLVKPITRKEKPPYGLLPSSQFLPGFLPLVVFVVFYDLLGVHLWSRYTHLWFRIS